MILQNLFLTVTKTTGTKEGKVFFNGTEKLKWGPVESSSPLLHPEFNRF